METVELVLHNSTFVECIDKINELEKNRVFCKHGLEHCLDVARIAYIISLEEQIDVDKQSIYLACLLHDIGRAKEYETGISHHLASYELAIMILNDIGMDKIIINEISEAIKHHRNDDSEEKNLNYLLYKADKMSRNCYNCNMIKECYWTEDKKNIILRY